MKFISTLLSLIVLSGCVKQVTVPFHKLSGGEQWKITSEISRQQVRYERYIFATENAKRSGRAPVVLFQKHYDLDYEVTRLFERSLTKHTVQEFIYLLNAYQFVLDKMEIRY